MILVATASVGIHSRRGSAWRPLGHIRLELDPRSVPRGERSSFVSRRALPRRQRPRERSRNSPLTGRTARGGVGQAFTRLLWFFRGGGGRANPTFSGAHREARSLQPSPLVVPARGSPP